MEKEVKFKVKGKERQILKRKMSLLEKEISSRIDFVDVLKKNNMKLIVEYNKLKQEILDLKNKINEIEYEIE